MTLVDELAALPDPFERARAAHEAFLAAERGAAALRDVRDLAFNELRHEHKLSVRSIAERLTTAGCRISKSRIADITG